MFGIPLASVTTTLSPANPEPPPPIEYPVWNIDPAPADIEYPDWNLEPERPIITHIDWNML